MINQVKWSNENVKIEEVTIQELIKNRIKTPAGLAAIKRKMAKKYKVPCLSNIKILKSYRELVKKKKIKRSKKIENLLRTRPIRSLSGIVNVSVLTKPYPCPGKCLYCPLERGMPKSYLSGEPAAERAKRLKFNPYLQVKKRIEMLKNEGHPTDKIDLRIIGGTWSYYPKNYQVWFIKECFRACNGFNRTKKSKIKNPYKAEPSGFRQKSKLQIKIQKLEKIQKRNEKAKSRITGISVETRPDFINERGVKFMRELGITRVELGVQSVFDDVLKLNLRGHGVREIILATKILKDAGFKICYQVMPNLLGSDLERDEKMFKGLFSNSNFSPDYLKIYPCALLKETPLYKWYLKGKYKPYPKEELIDLTKKIKLKIPYYVRIQRITRDIPSQYIIEGGAKISNLRQIVQEKMKNENLKCKCIRCREVRKKYNPKEKIYLFRENYEASGGKEIFLSFESLDYNPPTTILDFVGAPADKRRSSTLINADRKLYALLRLRIPSQFFERKKHFIKILDGAAIIREIQTFGEVVPIGAKKIAPQHRGLGKRLVKKVEKITKNEFGLNKIMVISGVGVREYWRKFGYKLRQTYMIKKI